MPTRKSRVKQADIVQAFAARLRELRRSRGLTQAELARQANVTVSYIWKLEAGNSSPGIDLVDRLAKALGVSISEMLSETAPPDPMAVLRDQAQRLTGLILETADRETLLMLNPLLARLLEAPNRRR